MDYIISALERYSKFSLTFRSVIKTILRYLTGKCELERICEHSMKGDDRYGYSRCHEVENCLYYSKHEALRVILISDKLKTKTAMETILRVKRIVPDKNPVLVNCLPRMLHKIISYNSLLNSVDGIRNIKYDEENEVNEEDLRRLWHLLKKEDKLSERHSKRWGEIGFQGNNPATDFRGMGVLSLKNMIYLLENHENIGMKIYGQSLHPQYGFSFAIMAIDFTGTAFKLLRSGQLKGWIYNHNIVDYTLETFQDFFVEIFDEFADYWIMRQPPNIMSFAEIKKDYLTEVEKRLMIGKWERI